MGVHIQAVPALKMLVWLERFSNYSNPGRNLDS